MKRTLIAAILLSMPILGVAEDKSLKERAAEMAEKLKQETEEATSTASGAMREAWRSTKAYLSPNPAEFRAGASRRLDELAGSIDNLRKSETGPMASRPYFVTRVRALQEHLDFARGELEKLPPDAEEGGYIAARKNFNRTLGNLENAVNAAHDEAYENH